MSEPVMSDGVTSGAWHRVNVGHLVMGVAFLGLAGIWALNASGAVTGSGTRFLFPLPWVAAGVVGLVASLASKRRRDAQRRSEAAERWDPVPTTDSTLPISLDKKDLDR